MMQEELIIQDRRPKVYIAAPYTNGGVEKNIQLALSVAETLSELGFIPIIPHLVHYWDLKYQHPYEFWTDYTAQQLLDCDYVLRIPGYSRGADNEVVIANKEHIPVVYSIKELRELI